MKHLVVIIFLILYRLDICRWQILIMLLDGTKIRQKELHEILPFYHFWAMTDNGWIYAGAAIIIYYHFWFKLIKY